MTSATEAEIVHFVRDMTLHWPCRRGDFLLWMGYSNIFSGPGSIRVYDIWEMGDGYHVTITNRPEDFPAWFELHPTEVCGNLAYKMMARMEQGYKPGERVDGPNLWRLKSGDRLAWVGAERPGRRSVDGILSVVDFQDCALVVGESNRGGLQEFTLFGAPTTQEMDPENAARCQAAVSLVKKWGIPRTWGPEWRLG